MTTATTQAASSGMTTCTLKEGPTTAPTASSTRQGPGRPSRTRSSGREQGLPASTHPQAREASGIGDRSTLFGRPTDQTSPAHALSRTGRDLSRSHSAGTQPIVDPSIGPGLLRPARLGPNVAQAVPNTPQMTQNPPQVYV